MTLFSQRQREINADHGEVVERVLTQNKIELLDAPLPPSAGEFGKQFDLTLEHNPPAILRLDSVVHLVPPSEAKCDALKNQVEQVVKVRSADALIFFAPLHYDEVIIDFVHFDMSLPAVLRAAIGWKGGIAGRSDSGSESINLRFDLRQGQHTD